MPTQVFLAFYFFFDFDQENYWKLKKIQGRVTANKQSFWPAQ
jgi:hypothetical protein